MLLLLLWLLSATMAQLAVYKFPSSEKTGLSWNMTSVPNSLLLCAWFRVVDPSTPQIPLFSFLPSYPATTSVRFHLLHSRSGTSCTASVGSQSASFPHCKLLDTSWRHFCLSITDTGFDVFADSSQVVVARELENTFFAGPSFESGGILYAGYDVSSDKSFSGMVIDVVLAPVVNLFDQVTQAASGKLPNYLSHFSLDQHEVENVEPAKDCQYYNEAFCQTAGHQSPCVVFHAVCCESCRPTPTPNIATTPQSDSEQDSTLGIVLIVLAIFIIIILLFIFAWLVRHRHSRKHKIWPWNADAYTILALTRTQEQLMNAENVILELRTQIDGLQQGEALNMEKIRTVEEKVTVLTEHCASLDAKLQSFFQTIREWMDDIHVAIATHGSLQPEQLNSFKTRLDDLENLRSKMLRETVEHLEIAQSTIQDLAEDIAKIQEAQQRPSTGASRMHVLVEELHEKIDSPQPRLAEHEEDEDEDGRARK
eukprot:m.171989 g.171989  ORF g.171989 m.171989 type:complete len:481 (+) comp25198_c0_seq2:59-1501(+)